MNMISEKTHPAAPIVSLVGVAGISYWLTTRPRCLERIFRVRDEDYDEEDLMPPSSSDSRQSLWEMQTLDPARMV